MTARSTWESSVASAGAAKNVTLGAALLTEQETINQSGCNAGSLVALQINGNAAFVTATLNAAAALAITRANAEITKQKSIDAARETLRATGDVLPL